MKLRDGVRARRGPAAGAFLLTAVLLATSCTTGGGQPGARNPDSTFDIAIGIDLDTVDPVQLTTTTVANVVDYSVETLTRLNKDSKIEPGLASSWNSSEDGRTLTMQLRPGVTFQDGTKFDAKAVKYSLDRLLDPEVKSPLRAAYSTIEKVDAVDDLTVRLNLSRPDPVLPAALSYTTAGIVSPASERKSGNSYKNIVHPVGTGPYSFKTFQKGNRATFERYDGYWGRKPQFRSVVFHIIPEAATRESLLRAGQAEMIVLPPVSDLTALHQSPDIDVLRAPGNRTIFVSLKTTKAPLDNPQVRQALNYAIDKRAMAGKVLFGAVDVMNAPMAASNTGYCPVGAYDYNPQKAKQLLDQAGVRNLSVTLGSPTGRYLQDKQAADAIAGNLRDVGVQAQVRTMDWASYLGAINVPANEQKFDMHVLGWAPSFPDASQQMLQFQTDQHPPAGLATSFYSNKKVDSLVKQAGAELDAQKRNQLYCEASKTVWNDAPWIFLWVQKYPIAYASDVKNISSLPNEKFDAIYASTQG
jgi:peptide/nickel transport system substrate-binding protein